MTRRKKSNLSPQTRNAKRQRLQRNQYNEEELAINREKRRLSTARLRASLTDEQREVARKMSRMATRNRRARKNKVQTTNKINTLEGSNLLVKNKTLRGNSKPEDAIQIKTEPETEDESVERKTDMGNEIQCSSDLTLLTVVKSEIDIEPTSMVEPRQLYEFEQTLVS